VVGRGRIARERRGVGFFGCLFQIAIVAAIASFGAMISDDVMAYYRYRDAMKQETRFAATRNDAEMMRRLRAFTDSVKLPPEAKEVKIVRDANRIRIWADYDHELRLPLDYSRTFHLRPSAERTY
jgi:hypothetical protein